METTIKKASKINQSITFKAMVIGFLTLILLIPGLMIQDLIRERQNRSNETIEKINAKWSNAQTFCGPVLSIPYTTTHIDSNNKTHYQEHVLTITPGALNINTQLFPEERYYGIYKTILYKSETDITGNFDKISFPKIENSAIHWDQAYLAVGVSDLRGITDNIDFRLDNKQYPVETTGNQDTQIGKMLAIPLNDPEILQTGQPQQIDRRFCVAVAFQNAVRLCQKGKHMAGAPEILRTCPFFNAFHRGDGALCSGDTGGCGYMVDGDGKRRLMVIRIVGHHLREPELLDICGRHGHTDQPLGMGGHKIDVPSGCKLGCTDEIAFVLPVGVVGTQDQVSLPQRLQCVFNRIILKHGNSSLKSVLRQKFQGDAPGCRRLLRCAQKLLHIFSNYIRLQVDRIARPFLSQYGGAGRMWNNRDRKIRL